MRYRVRITQIGKLGDEATMTGVRKPEFIEAADAVAATADFITRRQLRILGNIEEMTGNSATGACRDPDGRVLVIRASPAGDELEW